MDPIDMQTAHRFTRTGNAFADVRITRMFELVSDMSETQRTYLTHSFVTVTRMT